MHLFRLLFKCSVFCLLFFSVQKTTTAQPGCAYFFHKHQAETWSTSGRLDSAVTAYRRAFSIHTHDLADLLTAADRALAADSLDAAREFLFAAARCGLSWEDVCKLAHFAAVLSPKDWSDHFRALPPGADTSLIARIARLADRDQSVRPDEGDTDEQRMRAADSLNVAELRDIVTRLGRLPGYSDLGWQGMDNLSLLFVHMGPDDLAFFMPLVIAQIRAGEFTDNATIAYQMDRIAISSGLALYIDENDRLQALPAPMAPLTPFAFWSVTGEWYEQDPGGKYQAVAWPICPALGEQAVNLTRSRLCLDPLESLRLRKSWIKTLPLAEFRAVFGLRD